MSVKVEKQEKNMIKLEITVDKESFENGMQKAYLKNVKKFNIPGFRKGKAPRNIIERYYGEGVFYEDIINIICPEAYENALKQENIEAVSEPEIDIIQIGKGKEFIFSAKVAVKPEVKLGAYKGIEIEQKEKKISDEDVNNELEKMREKNARIVTVEDRDVENGDIVTIDFEGFADGVAFPGGKGEDYDLTIGSGTFIPGFEEQLIGKNINDDVDVNVKFPEEYHAEELAGKETLFKVKIKAIKVKEFPTLDDEFVKDVSEFDTLDELKKDIKEKLEHEAEHEAKHELENQVVKAVAEASEMELPEPLIAKQIENLVKDFDMRLKYQGLDIKKYLELTGTSAQDLKEQMKPQAIEQLRGRLALDAIAKAENISADDEEVEKEIQKMAESYKYEIEHFKEHLSEDDIKYIKEGIIFDKAIDFLVENAKIKS